MKDVTRNTNFMLNESICSSGSLLAKTQVALVCRDSVSKSQTEPVFQ